MELLVSLCIVLFATLNDVCGNETGSYKTIQTHSGAIRGVKQYTLFRNVSYYSFRGVPYAEKPIGNLRFKVRRACVCWYGDTLKFAPNSDCFNIKRNYPHD